eukprot:6177997-Pleurochrysis_carterae.AAC.7
MPCSRRVASPVAAAKGASADSRTRTATIESFASLWMLSSKKRWCADESPRVSLRGQRPPRDCKCDTHCMPIMLAYRSVAH